MVKLIKIQIESHFVQPYEIIFDGGCAHLYGGDSRFISGGIFNPNNVPDHLLLYPCFYEGQGTPFIKDVTDSEIIIEVKEVK